MLLFVNVNHVAVLLKKKVPSNRNPVFVNSPPGFVEAQFAPRWCVDQSNSSHHPGVSVFLIFISVLFTCFACMGQI